MLSLKVNFLEEIFNDAYVLENTIYYISTVVQQTNDWEKKKKVYNYILSLWDWEK